MALNGPGLWAARKTAMDAVTATYTQGSDAAAAQNLRDQIGLADSQAIVDYITANGHAVGTDSNGDNHNLTIE